MLGSIGAQVSKDVLNKYEQRKRRNAPTDLAWQLGIIFGESPLVFLLPEDGAAIVAITPTFHVRARDLYEFLVGGKQAPSHAAPPGPRAGPTERDVKQALLHRWKAQARLLAHIPYAIGDFRGDRLPVGRGLDVDGIRKILETSARSLNLDEES